MDIIETQKNHLEKWARKLKFGQKLVFQIDDDSNQMVAKWLEKNVTDLKCPRQSSNLSSAENMWAEQKRCLKTMWHTNLTQMNQFCHYESARIPAKIAEIKNTQKIWPKSGQIINANPQNGNAYELLENPNSFYSAIYQKTPKKNQRFW